MGRHHHRESNRASTWAQVAFVTMVLVIALLYAAACQDYRPIKLHAAAFAVCLLMARCCSSDDAMKYVLAVLSMATFYTGLFRCDVSYSRLALICFYTPFVYASLFTRPYMAVISAVLMCIKAVLISDPEPLYTRLALIGGIMCATTAYSVVFHLTRSIKRERDQYRELSQTDSLTGLATLDYSMNQAEKMLRVSSIGVFLLDVAGMKKINDTYGLLTGDRVLVQVADILRRILEPYECVIGRLGGDEFIIFANCDKHPCSSLGAKLLDRLQQSSFIVDPEIEPINLRFALGEAYSRDCPNPSLQDLIHIADRNMQYNKFDTENRQDTEHDRFLPRLPIPEIKELLQALVEKDMYTYVHSRYTAHYAQLLALELDLPRQLVEQIYLAGWLHDIGKLLISSGILRKTTSLTAEEYASVKKHVKRGLHILQEFRLPQTVINSISYHHERWDGTGYPFGLRGEETPIEARILQIADAFSAMTIRRVYRKRMSMDQALEELNINKGIQFDPYLTEVFTLAT